MSEETRDRILKSIAKTVQYHQDQFSEPCPYRKISMRFRSKMSRIDAELDEFLDDEPSLVLAETRKGGRVVATQEYWEKLTRSQIEQIQDTGKQNADPISRVKALIFDDADDDGVFEVDA